MMTCASAYNAQFRSEWGLHHLRDATLTITKLQLRECCFTTATLTQLLAACNCLKVFQYISMDRIIPYKKMKWPSGHPTDEMPMSLRDIVDAIAIRKDTLEEVYIDLRPWYGPKDYPIDHVDIYYKEGGDELYLGFQEFTRLKHLDLEADRLPVPGTTYRLPPNLETLVLRRCDVLGFDAFAGLACGMDRMVEEQLSALRAITLEEFWEEDSELQDLDTTIFDCTGKGMEEACGCCVLSPTPDIEIIIRNTARHTDTSDDWRCAI
jgi:hypothetical protein